MSGTNLHLFLSDIQHETRLVKEARATLSMNIFSRVRVLGLWDNGLLVSEIHPSGMEVERIRTILRVARTRFPSLRRGVVTTLLASLGFVQYAFAAAWQAAKLQPSHVSCHNLLLLPVAWMAAKLGGSKLVYVPHELEVERTGSFGWMKRLAASIEPTFIRGCSAVVVVCEPIADWYRTRYGLAKVFVVRAIPEVPRLPEAAVSRARIRQDHEVPDDALLFIYQGMLAAERGVDELLRVFGGLDDRFHLMLMGYGEAVDRIKAAAAECHRIHFQEAVPVDRIIQYSSAADVGVVVLHDPLSLSYQLSLPNKFFEYLYANLPVIVSDNLHLLRQIIGEHRIGWSTDSHELESLIKSLDRAHVESLRPFIDDYVSRNTWDVERTQYKTVYA